MVYTDNRDELFEIKSKRMNESHIVSLEIYAERIHLPQSVCTELMSNPDEIKFRVKFGDLPCMEIDGSFNDEFTELDVASMRCLKASSMSDIDSLKDFLRRTRSSLTSTFWDNVHKKSIRNGLPNKSEVTAKGNMKVNASRRGSRKQSKYSKTVRFQEGSSEVRSGQRKKLSGKVSGEMATNVHEGYKKSKYPKDSAPTSTGHSKELDADSALTVGAGHLHSSFKEEEDIPFYGSLAMVFPITPKQLLYNLINTPLMVYLIRKVNKKSAVIMYNTKISLYPMSDIVSHMIMLDGGVHSESKMGDIYSFCCEFNKNKKYNRNPCELRMSLRLATYGVVSCTTLGTISPLETLVKFTESEWTEEPGQQDMMTIDRDIGIRTPLVTGHENLPQPPRKYKKKKQHKEPPVTLECLIKMDKIRGA